MYRLPSPFNAKARNTAISAAGGGSTTTTCTCCIVTAGITCIATSVHFVSLAKPPADTMNSDSPAPVSIDGKDIGLGLLGFFAPILVCIAAALAALIQLGLGLLVAVGGWIGLFAAVYNANGRRTEKGIVAAIIAMIAIGVAVAIELAIWFGGFR